MVKPGMRGAVEFGTAHRAREDGPIAGKTGTCSENHTHLGWFGSFNDVGDRKLVVVVLLTGGRPAIGPLAAGIAGDVYRRLGEKNYFRAAQMHDAAPALGLQPDLLRPVVARALSGSPRQIRSLGRVFSALVSATSASLRLKASSGSVPSGRILKPPPG